MRRTHLAQKIRQHLFADLTICHLSPDSLISTTPPPPLGLPKWFARLAVARGRNTVEGLCEAFVSQWVQQATNSLSAGVLTAMFFNIYEKQKKLHQQIGIDTVPKKCTEVHLHCCELYLKSEVSNLLSLDIICKHAVHTLVVYIT
jgi:hypothetical protein